MFYVYVFLKIPSDPSIFMQCIVVWMRTYCTTINNRQTFYKPTLTIAFVEIWTWYTYNFLSMFIVINAFNQWSKWMYCFCFNQINCHWWEKYKFNFNITTKETRKECNFVKCFSHITFISTNFYCNNFQQSFLNWKFAVSTKCVWCTEGNLYQFLLVKYMFEECSFELIACNNSIPSWMVSANLLLKISLLHYRLLIEFAKEKISKEIRDVCTHDLQFHELSL